MANSTNLHRGLAVTQHVNGRRLTDRQHAELLAHDVAKLRPKSLLDLALDHIRDRDRELEAQIDQVDRDLYELTDQRQELTRQRRWLAEQRQQLIDEAASEKR